MHYKIGEAFKVEIQVIGKEKVDKDTLLDIQKKLVEVLKIKGEMKVIHQQKEDI